MSDQYGQDPAASPNQQPAVTPQELQPEQVSDKNTQPAQVSPETSPYTPPQYPVPPELSMPQGLPAPQYWNPQAPSSYGQEQLKQPHLSPQAPQYSQPEASSQVPQYEAPQYGQTQTPLDPQFATPPQVPHGTPKPPPAQPKKRNLGMLLTLIVGGVLLVAAAATTAIVLATGGTTANPEATKSPEASQGSDNDSDRTFGPDDPEIAGTGPLRDRLEAFQAELKQSNEDGTLWTKIPQTRENTGAYFALQIILTDMASATRFGEVSQEQATQWAKEAKYLEGRLLAQKPLGTTIHYVLGDGKVFDYNGDTGEVSFSDPKN